jgi:Uma2 family endonuclease
MSAIALTRAIDYPESDGRPMAETQVHGQVLLDLLHTFGRRYAEVPDVYVWGNMLLYYVEGNPRSCVAPDLFLVKGVEKRVRPIYKLWEEERAPSLVIEVTSKSTRSEDLRTKKGVYQRLGVEEYFLFDPLGEYLRPRLQGFGLIEGRYEALLQEGDGALFSAATGLRLLPEGERLRLRDATSGAPLLWADEEAEARQAAEDRADQEGQARQAAEDRADLESRARQAAEERLRALEEELARLRGDGSPRQ